MEVREARIVEGVFGDTRDEGVGEAFFFGGFIGGDVETLFADVIEDLLEFFVRLFSFYQADVEGGGGFFGDDVLRLLADVGAAQAADVEGRDTGAAR